MENMLNIAIKWAKGLLEDLSKAVDDRGVENAIKAAKKGRKEIAETLVRSYAGAALTRRLDLARRHLDTVVVAARRACYNVLVFKARLEPQSKLLTGASTGVLSGVFEVGLSWDHVYDLPFIPGSSLKGAVRTVAEELLSNKPDGHRLVGALFGSVGSSGCIEFFDAYPIEASKLLEADVITPHYYRGGEVVNHELEAQPVPVVHVSVAPGTVFSIVVAHRCTGTVLRSVSNALNVKVDPPDLILAILIGLALRSGIGARTTKGYGVFRLIDVGFEKGVCYGGGHGAH